MAATFRKRSIAQYSRAAGGERYRTALGALIGACVILCIASAALLVYRNLPKLQVRPSSLAATLPSTRRRRLQRDPRRAAPHRAGGRCARAAALPSSYARRPQGAA
jgi:hypothetical protein